jgi:asparagine synthase (glutamine-hydrolysing)
VGLATAKRAWGDADACVAGRHGSRQAPGRRSRAAAGQGVCFWWSPEQIRRNLFSAEFAAQIGSADPAEPLQASLAEIPAEVDPLQRMLFLETRHFLADHNLNYTDRAGMAAGVEVRVPLVDLELVDFAAKIPGSMKQAGTEGKSIFKEAMRDMLPHGVVYRRKSGFGAPLRRWLRHELRGRVEDTLDPAVLRRRGFFDPRAVRALIDDDRQGRIDGAYTIFALVCFELWCRRFIDGEAGVHHENYKAVG